MIGIPRIDEEGNGIYPEPRGVIELLEKLGSIWIYMAAREMSILISIGEVLH